MTEPSPRRADGFPADLDTDDIAELIRLEVTARLGTIDLAAPWLPWMPQTHAGSAAAKAVYLTLLDRPDDGLAVIRTLLDDERGFPDGTVERTELALVVGDLARAANEATVALGPASERFLPGYREYLRATLAAIVGDDRGSSQWTREARRKVGARPAIARMAPLGALDIVPGLIAGDAATFNRAVDELLGWHAAQIVQPRSPRYGSWEGFVCLQAVAFVRLAQARGISVTIGPLHRAAPARLRLHHLGEWRGRRLPRAYSVALDTDLVPSRWLAP